MYEATGSCPHSFASSLKEDTSSSCRKAKLQGVACLDEGAAVGAAVAKLKVFQAPAHTFRRKAGCGHRFFHCRKNSQPKSSRLSEPPHPLVVP